MKKIIISMICLSSLMYAKIVVGESIKQFNLLDQFSNSHTIAPTTKKLIFAFKKASGHIVKDFLKTKSSTYLSSKDILFIADVSAMPSFIKFFVLPITGYDYPIVTLDNNQLSKYYSPSDNSVNKEKIMVVTLENMTVKNIEFLTTTEELEDLIGK